MKNVSSKKGCMAGMTQAHFNPPNILLLKEFYNVKSEKYLVKLKLHRYLTLSTSNFYEFKMYLFENGEPEEFLLFVCNFNMTLTASGTLEAGTKLQYLRTIVRREVLRWFDLLSAYVESTETLDVDYIIRGLAQYFYHVNFLSKQKHEMRHGMKNAQSNYKTLCGALD